MCQSLFIQDLPDTVGTSGSRHLLGMDRAMMHGLSAAMLRDRVAGLWIRSSRAFALSGSTTVQKCILNLTSQLHA